MAMNLRCDETFVEDEGWHRAAGHYADFLRRHEHGRVPYWELGVGANTPGIIKHPFWSMVRKNPPIALRKHLAPCPEAHRGQHARPIRTHPSTSRLNRRTHSAL